MIKDNSDNYNKFHTNESNHSDNSKSSSSSTKGKKLKSNNSQQQYQTIKEEYDAIEPISIKGSHLVLSVAMRKDYEETIMSALIDIANHEEDLALINDYPYFRINPVIKFVPRLDQSSEILSERQIKELHMHLPYYQQYKHFKLLYSTTKHGTSMKTFYNNVADHNTSIVVIKDDNQQIFGGYLSEEIRNSQKFYGTGETFVFTFHNSERIQIFQASMKNENFIYSDEDVFAMGCDDKNFAMAIREDFLKGNSHKTITFNNQVLAYDENFFVNKFEVWSIID